VACSRCPISALCGSLDCSQGSFRLTCDTPSLRRVYNGGGPDFSNLSKSGSLTDISGKVCQGRSIPRRTIHASGDSPHHLSAKRHLLGTCLPRMAPFRSMLLTLRGGPQCLAPRAHRIPAYPVVFRHSYSALSRRTTPQR
jgi:hypothetical protein